MARQAEYQVRLYNTQGELINILTTWINLDYEKRMNDFSLLTLVLDAGSPAVRENMFNRDTLIEVWRRPAAHAWYRDAIFLHVSSHLEYTDTNMHLFTSYGRGLLDLIHRREIRYKSVAFTKQIGPGESCIINYVNQNAGPLANDGSRLTNGITRGLSVGADAARGSLYQGDNAFRNLLDVIQSIGAATGVDFDVQRLGEQGALFMFITGSPYLGTDRRSELLFSTGFGNILAPNYNLTASDEINSVAVLGTGTDVSRTVLVMTDDYRIAGSPWNIREASTNAGSTGLTADLASVGATRLIAGEPVETFSATVLQTPNSLYGIHYTKGDLVRVQIDDIIRDKKITNIKITVAEGREDIAIEFSDYGRM